MNIFVEGPSCRRRWRQGNSIRGSHHLTRRISSRIAREVTRRADIPNKSAADILMSQHPEHRVPALDLVCHILRNTTSLPGRWNHRVINIRDSPVNSRALRGRD